MLTDTQWGRLEPLVEACPPQGKTPPQDLRRTLSAILWRHETGGMRMEPSGGPSPRTWGPGRGRLRPLFAGPTWVSDLGVWERLLLLSQERGVQLGMTF